jgi:putative DNA primase/helicase
MIGQDAKQTDLESLALTAPAPSPHFADSLPRLLPHHLAELRKSGLTDATIKAAGIYSEAVYDKLGAIVNWKKYPKKMGPGMVYPFTDADGRNGYARFKPDHPRVVGGKSVKYESPKGQPNQVYLPPGVAQALPDPGRELLLTEGEKKALASTQYGFPCIGLIGVFGWKDGKQESLLPALERVAWPGRTVFIAFDSDITTNPEVQDAESRLAAQLTNRGAKVRVVRIPDGPPDKDGKPTKQGLDDYLVAQHADGLDPIQELRKLVDAAEEPDAVDPVCMKTNARRGLDATREGPNFLARTTQDGVSRLQDWHDAPWYWTTGAYRELQPSEVRANIVKHLLERYSNLEGRHISNVVEIVKAVAHLSQRVKAPAWLDQPDGEPWPADEILATRNGLIHLPALVAGKADFWKPATPRFFTTSALDFDFAIDAPRPTVWLGFLSQLWPDDHESIDTLQEWFGYTLTPDTRQQKILTMIGPKRSGKGTIARVQCAIVGKQNVAGPTLASLGTNFGLSPLVGKSLAIISDARLGGRTDSQIVVEQLLRISGEDPLTIDRKYREQVTCTLPTRLMLLSNELPRLRDPSGALAGRMILLQMRESFYGREDRALTDKLLAELPGILLWAIEGWRRLRERQRFSQPDSALELLGELHDLTSPLAEFLRDCCLVGPAYNVPRADLYTRYRSWCDEKGRKGIDDDGEFGRQLRAALPTLGGSQPRVDGRKVRHYTGVGLA